jgi:hypothetical protein
MDKLTKEARIELALSDLRKESIPSYTSMVERFLLGLALIPKALIRMAIHRYRYRY